MRILLYPHPTLLRRSKRLRRVDAELRRIIRQMFDLMYEHRGVGLAANQVDLPYRFFVMNPTGDPAAKDEEHVFINPVLSRPKGSEQKEEGCLSLPSLYADVVRPRSVTLNAFNLAGEEVNREVDAMFGRIVQHEADHLDGILFIDRLTETAKMGLSDELDQFRREFDQRRTRGEIPDDEEISARWAELEELRT